ncbi:membrane bound O-acyl transferase family domain containing protein [Rhypophila sp. PSN 637]
MSTVSTRGILPVDPTSPAPADPLSVLPYILLFILLLLAFYPQPFRFRGIIICTLVALLDWRSTVSPWPPNIGDTRPLKYGIASSWIFVLPVVERVLIHLPEKDFWRLDEEVVSELREDGTVVKSHRPSPPREWSWNKLRWSVSLFATPRAVGWNFGSRKINAQREEIRRARLALLDTGGGVAAFACYLVWDLVMVANRRVIAPRDEEWWSWEPEIIFKILWLEILMGITVYVGMNMQFDVAAAIGVGLRLNEPEDWPPLFGSITDCYTIANVWGKFWHQYMRQPCLGTSHFLLTHLNMLISRLPRCRHIPQIPKHSLVAYIFHLLTAFAISTFFHALSVGTVAVGITPVRGIVKNMAIFFMIQPFAAVFESFRSQSRRMSAVFWSAVVGRMVGYVWVLFWFYLTGQWFIRPYIDVGIVEWGLPFSFADWLLLPEGCR